MSEAATASGGSRLTAAQLRRASQITFAGTLLNFGVLTVQLLVITPLVIRAVGRDVNGAWVGSGDLLLWLQAFDFGLTNYAIQKMSAAYAKDATPEVSAWFWTTLLLLGGVGLLIPLVGPLISPLIYRPFDLPASVKGQLQQAFQVGLIASGITVISYAFTGLARALQRPLLPTAGVVLGSVLGVVVTWSALRQGAGINAVAYGMATRALISLLGGVLAFGSFWRGGLVQFLKPERPYMRESLGVLPSSALGSLGYAISTQSDNFLVGTLFTPAIATQFNTTRRVGDVARNVVETLGYANFAAFSHVFALEGAAGSQPFYQRLLRTHSLLSLVLGGGFILINERFMTLWLGPGFYLGTWVTTLMALQVLLVTRSYLHNTINRAIDRPQFAYWLQMGEALLKLAVILLVAWRFGLPGLLISASLIAVMSLLLLEHRNARLLDGSRDWQWPLMSLILILLGAIRQLNEGLTAAVLIALCGVAAILWRRQSGAGS